jgi:hypothetical protein
MDFILPITSAITSLRINDIAISGDTAFATFVITRYTELSNGVLARDLDRRGRSGMLERERWLVALTTLDAESL